MSGSETGIAPPSAPPSSAPSSPHADHAAPAFSPWVCVYASQVAACVGLNRHRKPWEAMMDMWERIDPGGFGEALRRNGRQTEEEALREVVRDNEAARELVDRTHAAADGTGSSAEVASAYEEAVGELGRMDLGDDERELVAEEVRRSFYTSYGTRIELDSLRYIREELGLPCHADRRMYTKRMGEEEGVAWHVGGRVDAVSDDGRLLVEIKNRVNRLFECVPTYERVQVETYLRLLDLDHGVLVQFLRDGEGVASSVTPLARDEALWSLTVVPKLSQFVNFLVRLLRDPALQDKFLSSKNPTALIRRP